MLATFCISGFKWMGLILRAPIVLTYDSRWADCEWSWKVLPSWWHTWCGAFFVSLVVRSNRTSYFYSGLLQTSRSASYRPDAGTHFLYASFSSYPCLWVSEWIINSDFPYIQLTYITYQPPFHPTSYLHSYRPTGLLREGFKNWVLSIWGGTPLSANFFPVGFSVPYGGGIPHPPFLLIFSVIF